MRTPNVLGELYQLSHTDGKGRVLYQNLDHWIIHRIISPPADTEFHTIAFRRRVRSFCSAVRPENLEVDHRG